MNIFSGTDDMDMHEEQMNVFSDNVFHVMEIVSKLNYMSSHIIMNYGFNRCNSISKLAPHTCL